MDLTQPQDASQEPPSRTACELLQSGGDRSVFGFLSKGRTTFIANMGGWGRTETAALWLDSFLRASGSDY